MSFISGQRKPSKEQRAIKKTKVLLISSASVGPLYISSVLKREGYAVKRLYQGYIEYLGEPSAPFSPPFTERELASFRPNIVGFSVDTASCEEAVRMASQIKKALPGVFTIFGGPHPTISPDETIRKDGVDAICVGEGEMAMLGVCNCLEEGILPTNVENIWAKCEGNVIKNPQRPYLQDLDSVPMDREGIFYGGVYTGRGCVGNCAFCSIPTLRRDGPGGKFFRKRSIESVLDEIAPLYRVLLKRSMRPRSIVAKLLGRRKEKGWIHALRFKDDTLLCNRKWFLEFAPRLKERFPLLRYICQARANEIDQEVVYWLKRSGCIRVSLGFESGSESVRNDVLNKNISDEQLLKACELLASQDIEIMGQWMYGSPGETFQDALKSLIMSVKAGDYSQLHMTTPLVGTRLFEIALKEGLIPADYRTSGLYETSVFHDGMDYLQILLVSILHVLKDVKVPANYRYARYLGKRENIRGSTLGEIIAEELESVMETLDVWGRNAQH
jgi:anaerobic magnesium-protoporphyrin IX monomethyl ester cyclase